MSGEKGTEGFDQAEYEEEVEERWGHTDAYRESKNRTASFTKEDWDRVEKEREAVEGRFAELLRAGAAPQSPEAMEAAEAHRKHIGNFYTCPPAMHVGLAEMYTADPRFAEHYNKREPGLAEFVSAAIRANADQAGAGD